MHPLPCQARPPSWVVVCRLYCWNASLVMAAEWEKQLPTCNKYVGRDGMRQRPDSVPFLP